MLNGYEVVNNPVGTSVVRQTLRERLEEQKKMVESSLENINAALDFMDKNPSFESFHNLIGKTGFLI